MIEVYKVTFTHDSKRYTMDLTINGAQKLTVQQDAALWFSAFFQKFFAENPNLSPLDLQRVDGQGVHLSKGRVHSHPDLFLLQSSPAAQSAKKTNYIWNALSLGRTSSPIALEKLSSVEPSHEGDGAKAEFEFLDPARHPHLLDQIPSKPRWKNAELLSNAELAQLEAAYLIQKSGKTVQNDHPSLLETTIGTLLGTQERRNYRMKLHLSGSLKNFFKKPEIQTDTILAKNSPLNGIKTKYGMVKGAITSSFNRFCDTISMLRKIEAPDQSSHAYAGRVDSDAKADEMARFVFLGEIEKFEDASGLSKGIRLRDDGKYELTFAVQSLLNMFGSQYSIFKKERKAYMGLAARTQQQPLQITNPATGKVYEVVVKPIPVVANQFNWTNYFESTFLRFAKLRAEKQTKEADLILFGLAQEKRLELAEERKTDKVDLLDDTVALLKEKKFKKPSEQIALRALLTHLLDLPEVVNCKSSVDRTGGVTIPLIFAMREWVDSGHAVPLVDGRRNIAAIFDETIRDEDGKIIYPARELFFFKMLHELKMSEFSRGKKGFKIFEAGVLHPALPDLLPKRFIKSGAIHFFDSFRDDLPVIQGLVKK